MTDSLRIRVARAIAGSAHALLDRVENLAPVAMLTQNLRELGRIIDEVRTELGRTLSSRHLAQQQHLRLNNEHAQIEQALEQALQADREDLAKAGIARQIDIEAQLPILEDHLGELIRQERELAGFVSALQGKHREMSGAIRDLERALSQPLGADASPASAAQQAQWRLERLEQAFDRTYERQSGLLKATGGTGLRDKAQLIELAQLTLENRINERLAVLRDR